MNGDILGMMARASRRRVERARHSRSEAQIRALARAAPPVPRLVLSGTGFDLIAEVKRRSPASGQLARDTDDIRVRVTAYADAGAAAISVLTEPSLFGGSLEHLERAYQVLAGSIPIMRKDFLVDPYQVYEARLAGAGGVLIILRMLERSELSRLLEAVAQLRLFALLEAFDEDDLALADELVREYGNEMSLLVGLNCRDLATLKVVPQRLETLATRLPQRGAPRVAESGVEGQADAARLAAAGYELALVGSALMKSADPFELARSLLSAGRAAVRRESVARFTEDET